MGASFDVAGAWSLAESVALRPEPFGALAYHYGTRRLSFLKSPVLVGVVRALGEHPSARDACRALGVDGERGPIFEALTTLADSGMIVPRVPA